MIASAINGIDFIEVHDDPILPNDQRQRKLSLHFVKPLAAGLVLAIDNVVIKGGERISDIRVTAVTPGDEGSILVIDVDRAGDFSIYTLCLLANGSDNEPPEDIDPALASVDFSFKVECPSDFDCLPQRDCPAEIKSKPPINYLAKDYASFRRLMLDRMALIAPDWQRRNAADLGMTLVELLAYVGDHLSYQQDAVQTEGYFDLARHRISVKRHARLVDYFMHDGCNARSWVQVQVDADNVLLSYDLTQFFTGLENTDTVIEPNSRAYQSALKLNPIIFEPIKLLEPKTSESEGDVVKEIRLFEAHNVMNFHTWSDSQCCLPRGALQATLVGHKNNLQQHDVLVFEEIMGPLTGAKEDADLSHRHAVKLTEVGLAIDPINNQPVTNIRWQEEDALPFAVCISSRTDRQHGNKFIDNVTVVRGNMVLCDHGQTVFETLSPKVPESFLSYRHDSQNGHCERPEPEAIAIRYKPRLSNLPLTHVAGYCYSSTSASQAMHWKLTDVNPAVHLNSKLKADRAEWNPVRDLINSGSRDNHFVVETENDGIVHLRFGNDHYGRLPKSETEFTAIYRAGNGVSGNIGADAISHIVTLNNNITDVRNLLPAQGGTDMETMTSVRSKAPYAYRKQERAVTEADYAEVTERQNGIQKAQATFRWTGSWHTVFLTIDRKLGLSVDGSFKDSIRQSVEKYRMAGHDLNVDPPRFVPLEISMLVCVKPDYFRSEVKRVLQDVFSSRDIANGKRGVFHPDNFTFGQAVYLSPLYEAAQSVAGVESVQINLFQRLHQNDNRALNDGKLSLDRLEIAQLDNDPNFRERGIFALEMGGGK